MMLGMHHKTVDVTILPYCIEKRGTKMPVGYRGNGEVDVVNGTLELHVCSMASYEEAVQLEKEIAILIASVERYAARGEHPVDAR